MQKATLSEPVVDLARSIYRMATVQRALARHAVAELGARRQAMSWPVDCERPASIDPMFDVPGAVPNGGGVSSLLIWVSLAGQEYDWASWQTAGLVGLGFAPSFIAVMVEGRRASRAASN